MFEPARARGAELLDDPAVADVERERSHRDIVLSNVLFGGRRAAVAALDPIFAALARDGRSRARATLLDVGTGLGDLAEAARRAAHAHGVALVVLGADAAASLLRAARGRLDGAVAADALALPLASASVDVVLCSQLLHHFEQRDAERVVVELHRVARRAVVVSDLQRSRLAAAGFRAAAFALRFHRITRHDGTLSVMRGFTPAELRDIVRRATGAAPLVRRRLGFRLTASWLTGTARA